MESISDNHLWRFTGLQVLNQGAHSRGGDGREVRDVNVRQWGFPVANAVAAKAEAEAWPAGSAAGLAAAGCGTRTCRQGLRS